MGKQFIVDLSKETLNELKDIAGTDPIEVDSLPENPSNYAVYRIYNDETIPEKFFNFDLYYAINRSNYNWRGAWVLVTDDSKYFTQDELISYLNKILFPNDPSWFINTVWSLSRTDFENNFSIIVNNADELIGKSIPNNNWGIACYMGKASITDIYYREDTTWGGRGYNFVSNNSFSQNTITNNILSEGYLTCGRNSSYTITSTGWTTDIYSSTIKTEVINHIVNDYLTDADYDSGKDLAVIAYITNPTKKAKEYLALNYDFIPLDSLQYSNYNPIPGTSTFTVDLSSTVLHIGFTYDQNEANWTDKIAIKYQNPNAHNQAWYIPGYNENRLQILLTPNTNNTQLIAELIGRESGYFDCQQPIVVYEGDVSGLTDTESIQNELPTITFTLPEDYQGELFNVFRVADDDELTVIHLDYIQDPGVILQESLY